MKISPILVETSPCLCIWESREVSDNFLWNASIGMGATIDENHFIIYKQFQQVQNRRENALNCIVFLIASDLCTCTSWEILGLHNLNFPQPQNEPKSPLNFSRLNFLRIFLCLGIADVE